MNLIEGLIALAERNLWARYCRLAAELAGGTAAPPVYAQGSLEWERSRRETAPVEITPSAADETTGRQRLARRGVPLAFAGMPSPLGARGAAAFDAFIAEHRGPPDLLAEIAAVEDALIRTFESAGRSGRYHIVGLRGGERKEVGFEWLGSARFDFANNVLILPDGTIIAAVEIHLARSASPVLGVRERPAQTMLKEALVGLWQRGAFTAGTGNERVLALILQELGLPAADPPYGFKSAETVRMLRKRLNMSL
jgi:hypothetical protein